jgi:hypothetical protein
MPQQQTTMINAQGVQPPVFRPAQTQVCAISELDFSNCKLDLFVYLAVQ